MNTQESVRYLFKQTNKLKKDVYCLKQYVQDHSSGGGGEFNGISTTTSGNINFSGNGTTSDPLSANISLKTINGEDIVGSGDIEIESVQEATPTSTGVIKYDNTSIKKNSNGQLYVATENYTLPTASETIKGGVIIGENLRIEEGVLSVKYKVLTEEDFNSITPDSETLYFIEEQ